MGKIRPTAALAEASASPEANHLPSPAPNHRLIPFRVWPDPTEADGEAGAFGRSYLTNFPSSWSSSPSIVMLPPLRRSQIMSQWMAELLTPPVSG